MTQPSPRGFLQILGFMTLLALALVLSGCLASTTSPDGVNCNYAQGKPMWEMPLDCQTGR